MDIVERLTAEEARMTRLWDCAEDFRTKHHGTPAAFDFNTLKHAVSGRDPVLAEAAAEITRLRAERDAAVARAERMEAVLRHCKSSMESAESILAANGLGDGYASNALVLALAHTRAVLQEPRHDQ